MDDIFKFVALRPPKTPSPVFKEKFLLTPPFQHAETSVLLRQLRSAENAEQSKEFANAFLSNDDYVPTVRTLESAVNAATDSTSVADAVAEVKRVLGLGADETLEEYLERQQTRRLNETLFDNLYAQIVVPDKKPDSREDVYTGLRALHYIHALKSVQDRNSRPPDKKENFDDVLPAVEKDMLDELPYQDENDPTEGAQEAEKTAILTEFNLLVESLKEMDEAAEELMEVGHQFRAEQRRTIVVEGGDQYCRGEEVMTSFKSATLDVPLWRVARPTPLVAVEPVNPSSPTTPGTTLTNPPFVLPPIGPIGAADSSGAAVGGTMVTASVVIPEPRPWVSLSFGATKLSPKTQTLLESDQLKLFVPEKEDIELVEDIQRLMHQRTENFLLKVPKRIQSVVSAQPGFNWLAEHVATTVPFKVGLDLGAVLLSPSSVYLYPHGSALARGIDVLGIGDLHMVKQQLVRYVPGEVAHIENIMHREEKSRIHKRTNENEATRIIEMETKEESEKNLQTTSRFELRNEAQEIIKKDTKAEAGVSVTASYGVVKATASGKFSYASSSSKNTKSASEYAKEVVDKSVERLSSRTRDERTQRSLVRVEETNTHGFNNVEGEGHVAGVYRWVDKYYLARDINYGKRLMIEFIVPEPAAFYKHLAEKDATEAVSHAVHVKKPEPPIMSSGRWLRPQDLKKETYRIFVQRYNVQDVESYPDLRKYVGAAIAEVCSPDKNVPYAHASDKLQIPVGYYCSAVYGDYNYRYFEKHKKVHGIEVSIGGKQLACPLLAPGLEGTVPITVMGYGCNFFINVVAKCLVKTSTIEMWQLKMYKAIMDAYHRELQDYNDQLADAAYQVGVSITGRNPAANRKIEQQELHKGCLRLLTNDFKRTGVKGSWLVNESFDAMKATSPYPDFDIAEAVKEAPVIQFFEQAFEWNNMTYRFYPYYWGRKENWDEVFMLDDVDPKFTDFLRSGSARVVLPVSSEYDKAVLYYLRSNRIWNGNDPPAINDPLFISIIEELKSDTKNEIGTDLPACSLTDPTTFPCVADSWEVKVPTSLVFLQNSGELPDLTEP